MAEKKPSTSQKTENILSAPQNPEAEASLIGSLLIDKDAIIKVADIVSSDDFYVTKNGQIYEAILGLFERREPVDVVTLSDVLEKNKQLENIGGASYLTSLIIPYLLVLTSLNTPT